MKRLAALVLAAATLGGCMVVNIDETTVFYPVAYDAALAEQAGEAMTGEKAFGSQEAWTSVWTQRAGKGQLPAAVAAFQPAKVEHARFATASGGIQYTLVTHATPQDTLIVRCGGNSTTRQHSGYKYAIMAAPHGDVLMFDYPGYGETGGDATPARFQQMSEELIPLIREKLAGRKLVLWGHSLGGFVCSQLTSLMPETDGLIVETSARNAREVAQAWTPWYAAPFVRIEIAEGFGSQDTANALKAFKGPVLVLGAENDETLPVQLARSVGKALKDQGNDAEYIEFKGGGHSNLVLQPTFAPTIAAFFAKVKN